MATELKEGESSNPLSVLVLSKRQYMSRDLIDDRYGRFRELPMALARLGATVNGLCLSYRSRNESSSPDSVASTTVAWTSLNMPRLFQIGKSSYWAALDRIAAESPPSLIWACSDVPHAVLGVLAARRLGAKLVIDLYDNFESYPLSRVPGVNLALRKAVLAADGITSVSAPLSRMVRERYGYPGPIKTIENAIPAGVFKPGDKQASRAMFGLPSDAVLIGTAGALSRGRGTNYLIEAFLKLSQARADVHLVLAGPLDSDLTIPTSDRIHYLGLIPADAVPMLLPALDISVVGNRNTAFGKYCFPQKLHESLACGLVVAVARVGAMADLLQGHPNNLYEPDDADSLAQTLQELIQHPQRPLLTSPTWGAVGQELSNFLTEVRFGHDS